MIFKLFRQVYFFWQTPIKWQVRLESWEQSCLLKIQKLYTCSERDGLVAVFTGNPWLQLLQVVRRMITKWIERCNERACHCSQDSRQEAVVLETLWELGRRPTKILKNTENIGSQQAIASFSLHYWFMFKWKIEKRFLKQLHCRSASGPRTWDHVLLIATFDSNPLSDSVDQ